MRDASIGPDVRIGFDDSISIDDGVYVYAPAAAIHASRRPAIYIPQRFFKSEIEKFGEKIIQQLAVLLAESGAGAQEDLR